MGSAAHHISHKQEGNSKEQLRMGEVMVVEGVEMDLQGMEWFMENPQGMLAMHDYMTEFMQEFEYLVVQLTVDYCAWGHFYMKCSVSPNHGSE